ncbi:MAG: DUF190 domain-containing protein [Gammaproteobacteria bacterium]|nr:DUF190 domain-containing protein [Gammaproteobacteria bacterium]
MKTREVTLVRIYLTEGSHQLDELMRFLKDREHICGVTVFRGLEGYGDSGKMHASGLLDISLNLPLAVEFFDQPEKINQVLQDLKGLIKPDHIVSWSAQINSTEE